jgi:nicotinate phosphoribosyltransferase
MSRRVHIATEQEIRDGRVADVYFERALRALTPEQANQEVTAEIRVRSLRGGADWGILAGIEEAMGLLEGVDVRVWTLPEGSVFYGGEPVMTIQGPYGAFGLHETALLGLLCQATGIATRAARCRLAAGDRLLLSFGVRRMHPALSPMIDRACYIGGCDGISTILAAEMIGIDPSGTMPHALVLLLGDTLEAAWAYHAGVQEGIPRVVLIDTFQDEKFEALRVAEAMRTTLAGVRFDTPGSRRGDLREIMAETRWELSIRGYDWVKLYASGGIDEDSIRVLNDVCDGYGVGTALSNAPTVDFALDIVEIGGQPVAKRGKRSGAKLLVRCPDCGARSIVYRPHGPGICPTCKAMRESLHRLFIDRGEIAAELPCATAIRQHTLSELAGLPAEQAP